MKYICSLITVEDIHISRKFYGKLLQQKVKYDFGENITFEGGFAIHLKSGFSKLIDGKSITKASNSFELYFEHDDIDAFVKDLEKRNIELVHDLREQPWGQKVVRFYDPDKNIIEVGESMEFLSFRLAKEGKTVEEISKITVMPTNFIIESIKQMKNVWHKRKQA